MELDAGFLLGFDSIAEYSLSHRDVGAFAAFEESAEVRISGIVAQPAARIKRGLSKITVIGVSFVCHGNLHSSFQIFLYFPGRSWYNVVRKHE